MKNLIPVESNLTRSRNRWISILMFIVLVGILILIPSQVMAQSGGGSIIVGPDGGIGLSFNYSDFGYQEYYNDNYYPPPPPRKHYRYHGRSYWGYPPFYRPGPRPYKRHYYNHPPPKYHKKHYKYKNQGYHGDHKGGKNRYYKDGKGNRNYNNNRGNQGQGNRQGNKW